MVLAHSTIRYLWVTWTAGAAAQHAPLVPMPILQALLCAQTALQESTLTLLAALRASTALQATPLSLQDPHNATCAKLAMLSRVCRR